MVPMVKKVKAAGGQPAAQHRNGFVGNGASNSFPNYTTDRGFSQRDGAPIAFDSEEVPDVIGPSIPASNGLVDELVNKPKCEPVFKPLSMKELLARPPKQWLLSGIFGAGDLGMIYGESGSGKTFLVIDMIMSLCTGRQWAMQFDVERPLQVAYCAGEGGDGLRDRFVAALFLYGIADGDLPGFSYYEVPQLFDDQGTASIHQFITDRLTLQKSSGVGPLDLLIIDTMHTATVGADENSSKDMGKVLHACRLAQKSLGCAVVLVHHTNKAGTGERGSSSLRGAMDFMLEVKRLSESDLNTNAALRCAKLKDGERWKDRTFDLTQVGGGIDGVRVWWNEPTPDGSDGKGTRKEETHRQAMLDMMKRYPSQKMTAKVLAEHAGITQPHATRLLSSMVKNRDCESEFLHPDKEKSNRNPLCYFVQ